MNVHLSIITMRYNLSKQTKTINHVEHRERAIFFISYYPNEVQSYGTTDVQ